MKVRAHFDMKVISSFPQRLTIILSYNNKQLIFNVKLIQDVAIKYYQDYTWLMYDYELLLEFFKMKYILRTLCLLELKLL